MFFCDPGKPLESVPLRSLAHHNRDSIDMLFRLVHFISTYAADSLAVITLRALYKRRKEQLDLQQMGEGLTFDHYYRLIFMVTLEMAATVPISIWNIISVYIPPFDDSWKNLATHRRGLDRVEQISTMSWLADGDTRSAIEHSEWISIACAICYFVAFGTTNEARDRYRLVALKFLEFFGVRKEVYNRR